MREHLIAFIQTVLAYRNPDGSDPKIRLGNPAEGMLIFGRGYLNNDEVTWVFPLRPQEGSNELILKVSEGVEMFLNAYGLLE